MSQLTTTQTGNIVGVLSVLFFGLCLLWGGLLTLPNLTQLHGDLMRIAYPGFAWSGIGIVIGIIEAFVYGWIFGALFSWLCAKACARGRAQK